jgi:hypothetical protein
MRSKLSLLSMTQCLSRRSASIYHTTRQEKKLYQSVLYELVGALLAFARLTQAWYCSPSQVAGRPSTSPPTQASAAASESIITTPRSSQALYKAQKQLLLLLLLLLLSETLSRSTRIVLGKAGKAIAAVNTRAAQLEAENQRLKYQLDHHKITRTRKRV